MSEGMIADRSEQALERTAELLKRVARTDAQLRQAMQANIDAAHEASTQTAPDGYVYRLVATDDKCLVQCWGWGEEPTYQELPAGAEFYAKKIDAGHTTQSHREAPLMAYAPEDGGDPDECYENPVLIRSDHFEISLFPEELYDTIA